MNLSQTDLINAFNSLNTPADFQLGNSLTVSTQLTLSDGRVIKIINDNGKDNYGGGIANLGDIKIRQSFDVSCPSSLAGTYAYVTTNCTAPTGEVALGPLTGNVTLTGTGGTYTISDASFGGWIGLYGPGQAATGVKLKDVCNKISYSGADQFGEVFTFSNLVISGNKMTFNWENDYGEKGKTELTKPNGNWPALFL